MVPGVPRYHKAHCILIRFMGDSDLDKMTLAAARKAGCTPAAPASRTSPTSPRSTPPAAGSPQPEPQPQILVRVFPHVAGPGPTSPSSPVPAPNSTASTSPAISAACSVSAAASSASRADQRSEIRSVTSRPSFLRASWTSLMTSRASPSRRSSGVMVMSMATVSPASAATAQPARGVWVTITSSGRRTRPDRQEPEPVTVPPASTAGGDIGGGAWRAIAAATAGVWRPNRRPRCRKFGFTT